MKKNYIYFLNLFFQYKIIASLKLDLLFNITSDFIFSDNNTISN